MQRLQLASLFLAAAAWLTGTAQADPAAFVVNERASSISVVDVNAASTVTSFTTQGSSPSSSGLHPSDAVFDARSYRLFVAGDLRLLGYDARLPDGRGLTQTPAQSNGLGLALDDVNRRIFMVHGNLGVPDGLVTEFSIADPLNPGAGVQHTLRNFPDLKVIAWEPKFRRLYVVADSGAIVRTDPGPANWTLTTIAGVGAQFPAAILADPSGGVWITRRFPGKLIRVTEAGVRTEFPLPGRLLQPATAANSLSWDPINPNTLLIAVGNFAEVKSFNTATNTFGIAMNTDALPADAGRIANGTAAGKLVSVNQVDNNVNGTATISQTLPATRSTGVQEKPVALVLADIPRLSSNPGSASYCYNQVGDSSEKSFTVSNTRLDRGVMNISAPTFGGLNPTRYTLGTNSCTGVPVAWGNSCTFRVRFTATAPSVEPTSPFPPPIGGFRPATWQAEILVGAGNDPSYTLHIPVRGALSASLCPGSIVVFPPIVPIGPVLPH